MNFNCGSILKTLLLFHDIVFLQLFLFMMLVIDIIFNWIFNVKICKDLRIRLPLCLNSDKDLQKCIGVLKVVKGSPQLNSLRKTQLLSLRPSDHTWPLTQDYKEVRLIALGNLSNNGKLDCTVVGLSTRPNPLIISKYLQFRTFWSQSKALFVIRCMSNVGSGSKMIGALKVTILCQIFELSVHKMSNFLRISACQWTIPSGLFAKKSHSKLFCSC